MAHPFDYPHGPLAGPGTLDTSFNDQLQRYLEQFLNPISGEDQHHLSPEGLDEAPSLTDFGEYVSQDPLWAEHIRGDAEFDGDLGGDFW